MPSLGSIWADITARTDGLEAAEARSRTLFGSIQTAGKRAMVGLAAAVGAATGALAVLTSRSLTTLDAQAKLARTVDGTVTNIQALTRASERHGVSQGEMISGLERMNARLGEYIVRGKGAEDTFKALGMSASQLAAMPVDQRIEAIASAMQRAGMSTQQMSYHLRQLGVRQVGFVRLLQDGGKEIERSRELIHQLGVAIDQDQAAAVERANDALGDMRMVFEGLANQLAVRVAPILENMAQRFIQITTEGGVLQAAVARIGDAFQSLSEVIMREETINAAVAGFEALINLAEGLANGLVFLSNNAEIATAAVTALTMALLGITRTPVGLAVTALAAGIMAVRTAAASAEPPLRDMDSMVRAAKTAQDALNASLGIFHQTGAPGAAEEALNLAVAYEEEARQALIAAEANYELAAARLAALTGFGDGGETNPTTAGVRADLEAANALVVEMRAGLSGASQTVSALRRQMMMGRQQRGAGGGEGTGDAEGSGDPLPAVPGVGGGGAVRDQFKERLEALEEGLMTERERLDQWYQESFQLLEEARQRGLLTDEEFHDRRERLEEEHQRRMNAIRQMGEEGGIAIALGAGNELLSGMRGINEKAFKMAKVFGAAQALAATLQAQAQALRDVPFPGNLAAVAAVGAKGFALVAAIKGLSSSGGGSRSAGGGGGGSAAAAASAPSPAAMGVNIVIQNDPFGIGGRIARDMAKQLNEAQRDGVPIRTTVTS